MGPDAIGEPFVAITGSIATGKSGLVERLSVALQASPLLENVTTNPYFEAFYREPERWAFHSQVAFATDSLRRHAEATHAGAVIQDRTVYETIDVFAALQQELGNLSGDDFRVLSEIRTCATELPRQPTALFYLHAPVEALMERVARRARPAERHITSGYLTKLQERYEQFVDGWSICPVYQIDTEAHDLRSADEIEKLTADVRRWVSADG